MDCPIHIDTTSMDLFILYFKESLVKISKFDTYTSVPEESFYLSKQFRHWSNAALCVFSSGSSLFAKVPVSVSRMKSVKDTYCAVWFFHIAFNKRKQPYVFKPLLDATASCHISHCIMRHFIWVFAVCQSTCICSQNEKGQGHILRSLVLS